MAIEPPVAFSEPASTTVSASSSIAPRSAASAPPVVIAPTATFVPAPVLRTLTEPPSRFGCDAEPLMPPLVAIAPSDTSPLAAMSTLPPSLWLAPRVTIARVVTVRVCSRPPVSVKPIFKSPWVVIVPPVGTGGISSFGFVVDRGAERDVARFDA